MSVARGRIELPTRGSSVQAHCAARPAELPSLSPRYRVTDHERAVSRTGSSPMRSCWDWAPAVRYAAEVGPAGMARARELARQLRECLSAIPGLRPGARRPEAPAARAPHQYQCLGPGRCRDRHGREAGEVGAAVLTTLLQHRRGAGKPISSAAARHAGGRPCRRGAAPGTPSPGNRLPRRS